MTAKILIKRTVPEGAGKDLSVLLNRLRALTMQQPGYISGETLKRADKPGSYLVISTWQSMEHWREWVSSDERAGIQSQIDDLIKTETLYEAYVYA